MPDSTAATHCGRYRWPGPLGVTGIAEAVRFVQGYSLPMLLLGGGSSSTANSARCWSYVTARVLRMTLSDGAARRCTVRVRALAGRSRVFEKSRAGGASGRPLEIPYNDYYEYFAPRYRLSVPAGVIDNVNTPAYVNVYLYVGGSRRGRTADAWPPDAAAAAQATVRTCALGGKTRYRRHVLSNLGHVIPAHGPPPASTCRAGFAPSPCPGRAASLLTRAAFAFVRVPPPAPLPSRSAAECECRGQ